MSAHRGITLLPKYYITLTNPTNVNHTMHAAQGQSLKSGVDSKTPVMHPSSCLSRP